MFLKKLIRQNRKFIDISIDLYKKNKISPDTYCIDVDQFLNNAKLIYKEAKKEDIKLFYMLKQVGRNPYLAKELEKIGYSGAVCVDFKEVEIMMSNNCKIGNVGHLVQIPKNMLQKVIEYGTEVITVYSYEMIELISKISSNLSKKQDILLKIVGKDSSIYRGQESGFYNEELDELLKRIKNLKGVNVIGVTSFPCFLSNNGVIESTNNVKTLEEAIKILQKHNIIVRHVNLPSLTSTENISLIKKYGGTHGEPGHSFTGTIPVNNSEEIISYLYLSEISHHFNDRTYFYGGGYYHRGHLKKALINEEIVSVNKFNSENIDYYLSVDGKYPIFSPVIMCFRAQMFVTRSDIALIKGISNDNPEIIGIYNSQGMKKG